jgi:hypothetical protein
MLNQWDRVIAISLREKMCPTRRCNNLDARPLLFCSDVCWKERPMMQNHLTTTNVPGALSPCCCFLPHPFRDFTTSHGGPTWRRLRYRLRFCYVCTSGRKARLPCISTHIPLFRLRAALNFKKKIQKNSITMVVLTI